MEIFLHISSYKYTSQWTVHHFISKGICWVPCRASQARLRLRKYTRYFDYFLTLRRMGKKQSSRSPTSVYKTRVVVSLNPTLTVQEQRKLRLPGAWTCRPDVIPRDQVRYICCPYRAKCCQLKGQLQMHAHARHDCSHGGQGRLASR